MSEPYQRFLSPTQQIITGNNYHHTAVWLQRPHGLREWVLHLTLQGSVRFNHAEGHIQAGPGDIVLIRPGSPQDYGVTAQNGQWKVVWAVFDPRPMWHTWMQWPEVGPGHLHLHLSDSLIRAQVRQHLIAMDRLRSSAGAYGSELAANALEAALLWCQKAASLLHAPPEDPRIARAATFLADNLSRNIRLKTLAAEVGLSVPHLTRVFRAAMGCSPGEYLERERLQRARQLLNHTALSISAIAWEVGFENPFYFTQRFTRHTGMCPRLYRRNNRTGSQAEPCAPALSPAAQAPPHKRQAYPAAGQP